MHDLEALIEQAFENRTQGFSDRAAVESAVDTAIGLLDSGKAPWQKSAAQTGTSTNG